MSTGSAPLGRRLRGLHVLADDDPRWKFDPVEQATAACRGGADVVQLRVKSATDREALSWAEQIRAVTRASGALFFVNDRFDLALSARADGVHLGQTDLPPARIPRPERERLLVGHSTHTLQQADEALREPVDYLAFGPVFGTRSKRSEYTARGIDALAEVAARVAPLPLVGIGGIELRNAESVARAGAGVAVISAVAAAEDPAAATRALARLVSEARA